ncbi:MAG: hypothetical protein IKA78_05255 [Oscillospiraceae bacterium]|nr:hypothetical protein [Oscillospiraceae bacterium]
MQAETADAVSAFFVWERQEELAHRLAAAHIRSGSGIGFADIIKEAMKMPDQYGSVVAKVVTSSAMSPVEGAALTITRGSTEGKTELLAVRLSDENGFTAPFYLEAPDEAESERYQTDTLPYATVDLLVDRYGYDPVSVRGAQIFAGTQSLQPLTLIPTAELPDSYAQTKQYDIPAQII